MKFCFSILLLTLTINVAALDINNSKNASGNVDIESLSEPGFVKPPSNTEASYGYDAQPTEVLVDNTNAPTIDADNWKNNIINNFKNTYKNAGKPKIAVFWNHVFDDSLSQWHANKRAHISRKEKLDIDYDSTGKDKTTKTLSLADRVDVEQQFTHCDNGVCYQTLKPKSYAGDNMQSKTEEFEFNSGFVSVFLQGNAKLLDRAAIMRLEQRSERYKDKGIEEADRQMVETDALIDRAEYLAEINYSNKVDAQLGVEFLVTIKKVKSGEIIAMFRTEALPIDLESPTAQFEATPNGFVKKITNQLATPKQVGQQLAYETMEAFVAGL